MSLTASLVHRPDRGAGVVGATSAARGHVCVTSEHAIALYDPSQPAESEEVRQRLHHPPSPHHRHATAMAMAGSPRGRARGG